MKTKKIIILAILVFLISFWVSGDAKAAYSSQCSSGQSSGDQTGCVHTNDQSILDGQCVKQYGSGKCGSMSSYLSALKSSCASKTPSGIDCATIAQGGYYGREAAKMAAWAEDNGEIDLGDNTNPTENSTEGMDCSDDICYPSSTNLPSTDMVTIITNVLNWLLSIFGILAVIFFVISGVMYIISTGDEKMMDKAKSSMISAVIGVAIALAGLIIIFAIDKLLRGTSNF